MWTTLELMLHADGGIERRVTGASPFPRHWIYEDGVLTQKSGTAETALERELSALVMQSGTKPRMRGLAAGETLVEQGQRARTPCRVAVADADQVDRQALEELTHGHRREHGQEPTASASSHMG